MKTIQYMLKLFKYNFILLSMLIHKIKIVIYSFIASY